MTVLSLVLSQGLSEQLPSTKQNTTAVQSWFWKGLLRLV